MTSCVATVPRVSTACTWISSGRASLVASCPVWLSEEERWLGKQKQGQLSINTSYSPNNLEVLWSAWRLSSSMSGVALLALVVKRISQTQGNTRLTIFLPLEPWLGEPSDYWLWSWEQEGLESFYLNLVRALFLHFSAIAYKPGVAVCFAPGTGLGWMEKEEGSWLKSKANWILEATAHCSGNAIILTTKCLQKRQI